MRNKKTTLEAVKQLINSEKIILNYLKQVVKKYNFNYRTFGVDIESYISNILIQIFKKNKFIRTKNDYKLAPHKNYFPDFELKTIPSLAIEYKAGNKLKTSKGKWVNCENSNNDLGTLNMWQEKIKKFGGEKIYFIFVIYRFDNRTKSIIDVQIAPFYRFIGLNREKLLRYREKDGNLRPKDFDEDSPIKSFKAFDQLFKKTIKYRSARIIKKHQAILKLLRSKK